GAPGGERSSAPDPVPRRAPLPDRRRRGAVVGGCARRQPPRRLVARGPPDLRPVPRDRAPRAGAGDALLSRRAVAGAARVTIAGMRFRAARGVEQRRTL